MRHLDVGEMTRELLDLARLASSAQPDSPPPQGTLSVRMDLPAPLLQQIQSQLGALPAGYRQILPSEDRNRLEALLQSRRGDPEDFEFLKATVLAGHLPRFAQEVAHFKARIEDLQAKVKEPTHVDVLYHKVDRPLPDSSPR